MKEFGFEHELDFMIVALFNKMLVMCTPFFELFSYLSEIYFHLVFTVFV